MIKKCICGDTPKLISNGGYQGDSNGYAKLECSCGLFMEETTYNLGFGTSLNQLESAVIQKWNAVLIKLEP
jgi:hypothetical protein